MRYRGIDSIRGITLVSMILYHTLWDLVYLYGAEIPWFGSRIGYIWQQSICWSFILLSGFCWPLGRKKLRRGLTVFGAGMLVTAVTLVFMPQQKVVFGVLTLLGSCMLLMIPAERMVRKVAPIFGILCSVLLFLLFRDVNEGFLGFEGLYIYALPEGWYRNLWTAYWGFPHKAFFSIDYFSVLPWFFLFGTGYFLHKWMEQKDWMHILCAPHLSPLELIGRHSLVIYLCHQPVIYLVLSLVYL